MNAGTFAGVGDGLSGGSSGLPIGYTMLMPITGSIVTIGNQQWLKSGLAVNASAYPDAAKEPSLKIASMTAHSRVTNQVRQIATDGNGTFVAVDGSNNTLYTSTDGGATWASYTASLFSGTLATGVAFGGGRFVAVGNDAGAIYTSWSTNGTTWNIGSSVGGTYTAGTAAVIYGNSLFVGIAGDTATNSGFTSANGSSLTAFNLASGVTSPQIAWNGNGFFILGTGTNGFRSSNGSTWTATTVPFGRAAGTIQILAGANGVFAYIYTATFFYRSTDNGVTWIVQGRPWGNVGTYGIWTGNNQFLAIDISTEPGSGKTVWVSSDFSNWNSLRFNQAYADGGGTVTALGYDGTRLVTLSDATGYFCSNVNQAAFVGLVDAVSSGTLYGYVRIK